MTDPHLITDPADARRFITAGRARVTLVSRRTGTRFTFRVKAAPVGDRGPSPRPGGVTHFVSVLTQGDNESGYTYAGQLRDGERYEHGRRSPIAPDAPSAKAFRWTFDRIVRGEVPECVEVWHEGACGRCGRALTVPESIQRGIGPECWEKMAGG